MHFPARPSHSAHFLQNRVTSCTRTKPMQHPVISTQRIMGACSAHPRKRPRTQYNRPSPPDLCTSTSTLLSNTWQNKMSASNNPPRNTLPHAKNTHNYPQTHPCSHELTPACPPAPTMADRSCSTTGKGHRAKTPHTTVWGQIHFTW